MAVRKTKKGADLKRWFKEDWRTPKGNKDYSKGENTFRPTKKISKDTPKTWSQLSASDKAKAKKEKDTKGRVSRYNHGGNYRGGLADKNIAKATDDVDPTQLTGEQVLKWIKNYN